MDIFTRTLTLQPVLQALLEEDEEVLEVGATLGGHHQLGAVAEEALDDQLQQQHQVVPLDDHRLYSRDKKKIDDEKSTEYSIKKTLPI